MVSRVWPGGIRLRRTPVKAPGVRSLEVSQLLNICTNTPMHRTPSRGDLPPSPNSSLMTLGVCVGCSAGSILPDRLKLERGRLFLVASCH